MVEDPVAKVSFPKFAAGATLEHGGKTHFFIDDKTKAEFARQNGIGRMTGAGGEGSHESRRRRQRAGRGDGGYALVMRGVGREIVLVDKNAGPGGGGGRRHPARRPVRPPAGGAGRRLRRPGRLPGRRVCAGVGQKPGETRLQLLRRNAAVFREVVPEVLKHAPDAVLLVATNPVDVMTHLAARFAAEAGVRPGPRVRVRHHPRHGPVPQSCSAAHCGVDSHHVHAHVVGEHGRLGGAHLVAGDRRRHAAGSVRPAARHRTCREAVRQGHRREGPAGRVHDHRRQGGDVLRDRLRPGPDRRRGPARPAVDPDGVRPRRRTWSAVKDVTVSLPRLVGGAGVIGDVPAAAERDRTGRAPGQRRRDPNRPGRAGRRPLIERPAIDASAP